MNTVWRDIVLMLNRVAIIGLVTNALGLVVGVWALLWYWRRYPSRGGERN